MIQPTVQVTTVQKTTLATLNNWEAVNDRCWVEEIHSLAEAGKTWCEVATVFNVEAKRLKRCCYNKGFRFPFRKKPRVKTRRTWKKGDPRWWSGQKPNYYTYRGERKTLKELSATTSIKVTTIYYRIHQKKWSVEAAVETPVATRSQAGRMGGLKRLHET